MRYVDDIPGNREAVATRFVHDIWLTMGGIGDR